MNSLYFYTTFGSAIALIFLAIHIKNDHALSTNSRRGFALSAVLFAIVAAIECICAEAATLAKAPAVFSFLILLELLVQAATCSTQCLACDMPRLGKISGIIGVIYFILVIWEFFTGKLFFITEEGQYIAGSIKYFHTAFMLIQSCAVLIVLGLLSKRYKNERPITLLFIGTLFILSSFGSSVTGCDAVGVLFVAFSYYLLYTYYTSLCSKLMTEKIKEDEFRLQQFSLQSMQALANAIDAKDKYTNGHSRRVSEYAVLLARELKWDESRVKYLKYAALIHDIGKIAIPDSVLNKSGRLTDMEFEMMKVHTVRGSEIAAQITEVPETYDAARGHHERYDGKGYPDGLSGSDIPETARLIAVVDTFDAMNSDRIYRKALPKQVILQELLKGSGKQFDPAFVKVFAELYDSGKLDAIAAEGRKDMAPQEPSDAFSVFAKYVFAYFSEHDTSQDGPKKEFRKWGDMNRCLKTLTMGSTMEFDLVVISICPAQGRIVEETQQENAIQYMIESVGTFTNDHNVCAKISETQIAVLFRRDNDVEISKIMQQIFLYFYKVMEAGPFSIEYRIIGPDEEDE